MLGVSGDGGGRGGLLDLNRLRHWLVVRLCRLLPVVGVRLFHAPAFHAPLEQRYQHLETERLENLLRNTCMANL